ncbi:hypothetical protein QE250_12210 [Chromatiaceae bacterium AAb-1]|jgi:hypothetical protein|nr:hypothetical protein [Chromatiaceae bacterium AAb-1]
MAYLTDAGLLPEKRLEEDLSVKLVSIIEDSVSTLQQQRPRIYQDLLSYCLNPFQFPLKKVTEPLKTANAQNIALPDVPLYWQRLVLPNNTICSELVIISWQSAIYISYLNILPDTFGLFTPLCPQKAMAYVDSLIAETLTNIGCVARATASTGMVSTLTNPNLAAIFKRQKFKEAPAGPLIVGLPLPARFFRLL